MLIHNHSDKKNVGSSVTLSHGKRPSLKVRRLFRGSDETEAPRRSVRIFYQMQNAKMSRNVFQRIQISPSVFKDRNPSEVKANAAQEANLHID